MTQATQNKSIPHTEAAGCIPYRWVCLLCLQSICFSHWKVKWNSTAQAIERVRNLKNSQPSVSYALLAETKITELPQLKSSCFHSSTKNLPYNSGSVTSAWTLTCSSFLYIVLPRNTSYKLYPVRGRVQNGTSYSHSRWKEEWHGLFPGWNREQN